MLAEIHVQQVPILTYTDDDGQRQSVYESK